MDLKHKYFYLSYFQRVTLEHEISILENRFKMTDSSKFNLFPFPLWNIWDTRKRPGNNTTGPWISIQSPRNQAFSLVFNLSAAEQNYIEFAFAFLPACWPRKLFFLTYRCSCPPAHHKTGPFSEFSKLPWRICKPTHPLPHYFFAISHWFLRCILEKVCLSISLTLTAMKPSFYSLTSVATSFHFN